MRYADEHTQEQFELLQRKGGRPPNSPGWGMLVACKTGAYISERNPADRADITAGSTRVSRDFWLVRERPELFKPADSRDARTFRERRQPRTETRGAGARQADPPGITPQGRARTQGRAAPQAGVATTSSGHPYPGAAMSDDGLELLRALLERVERRTHGARPRYRPLRWRRRREAHRAYMRFARGHPRCTS